MELRQEKLSGIQRRIPNGIKITRTGQIFTINNLQKSDDGRYQCKVALNNGHSLVNRVEELLTLQYKRSGSYICI